jgi:hypothetical protein
MSTKPTHRTQFLVVAGEVGLRKSDVVRTLVEKFKKHLIAPTIHTTGVPNSPDLVHVEVEEFKSLEPMMIVQDDIAGVRYGTTSEVFLDPSNKMPVLRLRPEVAQDFQAREGRDVVHVINIGEHGMTGVLRHTEQLLARLHYD